MVVGFENEKYSFLSNFYPCQVKFDGVYYPTVEHAFQAAKSLDDERREIIRSQATPGQAKNMGRRILLRKDWERIKLGVMEELLRQKFSIPFLRELLRSTLQENIEETNTWHDQFWGNCVCLYHITVQGENWLGELLMQIRSEL